MVPTTLNDDELPPNNSDDDYIFTTTDLEEGIEIPIEIIGTSLSVVVTSVDDEDDQYHLTALKKNKKVPSSLSPTKTVGTIESDDFELDDAISNEKTNKLSFCCCTSSNNKRPLFITLAIIATLAAIIALSLSTSYLLLNSNNNKAVEDEKQIQPSSVDDDDVIIDNDGNDDGGGGDKQHPKEDTSTTPMTTTTTTTTTTTRPRDLFLLSGQSNMVGHTSSSQSIEGNGRYWKRIKSILEQQGDDENNLDTMERKLYQVIYETNYYNDQVATTLTNGVMDLYKSSLLNDLDTPLTFGKCSFQEASDSQEVEDVSHGTVPISLNSNCGHTFGHELLFGRTLELGMNYTTTDFELHKVARGGSSLFEHWYPNHGEHWNLLQGTIESRFIQGGGGGDWKGFIWHQGSQEAWSEEAYGEDRSRTYYGNLTGLVNEVRELMFQNSITWQCKEEIPVVIVQVGSWPGNNAAAQRTRDAQARFCNEDPRAVLVKTDDLSTFYHYDAASFLISGNRIAYAYQEALGGAVECPDRVPSSSPSDVAVSSLSSSSSVSSMPTVIRLEADLPSSTISELV